MEADRNLNRDLENRKLRSLTGFTGPTALVRHYFPRYLEMGEIQEELTQPTVPSDTPSNTMT